MAGLVRNTEPDAPLTVETATAHLKLLSVDADTSAFLTLLILRAAQSFEEATRRAIMEQTWTLYLDEFPDSDTIQIPRPPLVSVESVKYYDSDGVLQTLDSSKYRVHKVGVFGEVEIIDSWPATQSRRNAVEIAFTAGYSDDPAALPPLLVQGLLFIIAHWYLNREMYATGTIVQPIPDTAKEIIHTYRAEW